MTDVVVWHRADLRTVDNAVLTDRANEALSKPVIRRRGSFSNRRRRDDQDAHSDGQTRLDEFD